MKARLTSVLDGSEWASLLRVLGCSIVLCVACGCGGSTSASKDNRSSAFDNLSKSFDLLELAYQEALPVCRVEGSDELLMADFRELYGCTVLAKEYSSSLEKHSQKDIANYSENLVKYLATFKLDYPGNQLPENLRNSASLRNYQAARVKYKRALDDFQVALAADLKETSGGTR